MPQTWNTKSGFIPTSVRFLFSHPLTEASNVTELLELCECMRRPYTYFFCESNVITKIFYQKRLEPSCVHHTSSVWLGSDGSVRQCFRSNFMKQMKNGPCICLTFVDLTSVYRYLVSRVLRISVASFFSLCKISAQNFKFVLHFTFYGSHAQQQHQHQQLYHNFSFFIFRIKTGKANRDSRQIGCTFAAVIGNM